MTTSTQGPTHYRLRDILYGSRIVVKVEQFFVFKETPQGYWVANSSYLPPWMNFTALRRNHYLRWVSKTSGKRYCYPDLADAVRSFNRRKEVQVSKLLFQLEKAQVARNFVFRHGISLEQLINGVEVGRIEALADLGEW